MNKQQRVKRDVMILFSSFNPLLLVHKTYSRSCDEPVGMLSRCLELMLANKFFKKFHQTDHPHPHPHPHPVSYQANVS